MTSPRQGRKQLGHAALLAFEAPPPPFYLLLFYQVLLCFLPLLSSRLQLNLFASVSRFENVVRFSLLSSPYTSPLPSCKTRYSLLGGLAITAAFLNPNKKLPVVVLDHIPQSSPKKKLLSPSSLEPHTHRHHLILSFKKRLL